MTGSFIKAIFLIYKFFESRDHSLLFIPNAYYSPWYIVGIVSINWMSEWISTKTSLYHLEDSYFKKEATQIAAVIIIIINNYWITYFTWSSAGVYKKNNNTILTQL